MGETTPNQNDIVEIDGTTYRKVDTGYTIREWFSHSGPGWDHRMRLLDPNYSQQLFGRTFSDKQVDDPSQLPDEPMYRLEEVS